MGPRDWLYPEVNIEITREMVGEKDCEPGANISNEWTKGSYWEIGGVQPQGGVVIGIVWWSTHLVGWRFWNKRERKWPGSGKEEEGGHSSTSRSSECYEGCGKEIIHCLRRLCGSRDSGKSQTLFRTRSGMKCLGYMRICWWWALSFREQGRRALGFIYKRILSQTRQYMEP